MCECFVLIVNTVITKSHSSIDVVFSFICTTAVTAF